MDWLRLEKRLEGKRDCAARRRGVRIKEVEEDE
jgi:hypothetical protein